MGLEIWIANWYFDTKHGFPMIAREVVTKRVPDRFITRNIIQMERVMKNLTITQVKDFIRNKRGQFKIRVQFIKKVGESQTDGYQMA